VLAKQDQTLGLILEVIEEHHCMVVGFNFVEGCLERHFNRMENDRVLEALSLKSAFEEVGVYSDPEI